MDAVSILDIPHFFFYFAVATFAVQLLGWLWVRRIGRRLKDKDGSHLIGIISFLMGWLVLIRLFGLGIVFYYSTSSDEDTVLALTVLSQIAFLSIVGVVYFKLRRFMS